MSLRNSLVPCLLLPYEAVIVFFFAGFSWVSLDLEVTINLGEKGPCTNKRASITTRRLCTKTRISSAALLRLSFDSEPQYILRAEILVRPPLFIELDVNKQCPPQCCFRRAVLCLTKAIRLDSSVRQRIPVEDSRLRAGYVRGGKLSLCMNSGS